MSRLSQTGYACAVTSLLLLHGMDAQAAGPSFDCAKAESSAKKLVCSVDQLAALDRETARLYGLALKGPQTSNEHKAELKAYQRGWIKGRDECWKATDKRQCVRDRFSFP